MNEQAPREDAVLDLREPQRCRTRRQGRHRAGEGAGRGQGPEMVAEEGSMILAEDYPKVEPDVIGIHNDAIRNPAFLPILADWYETHGHHEAAALAWFGRPYHAWIAAGFDSVGHWLRPTLLKMGRFLIESGVSASEADFLINRSAKVESMDPSDLIVSTAIDVSNSHGNPLNVELYLFRRHPR